MAGRSPDLSRGASRMLEVAEARSIVLRHARPLAAVPTPLTPPALGRVLAEDVPADLDSPPFDKSMMDGYAVRSADCAAAGADLRVTGELQAGGVPATAVGTGEAIRIFTGAPIPAGADAVVMQEQTTTPDAGRVRLGVPVKAGTNVLRRGREMRAGDVVLTAGTPLTPAAFGLAATLGRTTVLAHPAPRVGVIATGNEIVGADRTPGPGQIRNSNGPMLAALAARAGGTPLPHRTTPDDTDAMRTVIRDGLGSSDLLLLVGGVSVGKYDLVPGVLADLGVTVHFHKVRMKPGKPLLFGTAGDVLVFGLPGNPVSAFVGFELFVRPALRALAGHRDPGPAVVTLPLAEPLTATNDRPTYQPAKLERGAGGVRVRPLPWFGSADLRGLLTADALLALPPGELRYEAGQVAEVVMM